MAEITAMATAPDSRTTEAFAAEIPPIATSGRPASATASRKSSSPRGENAESFELVPKTGPNAM